MISSQEARSGVAVGVVVVVVVAVLVGILVGAGMLVVCRSGKAVEDETEISCDEEIVNDVVGAMITLVELAMDAELDTTI